MFSLVRHDLCEARSTPDAWRQTWRRSVNSGCSSVERAHFKIWRTLGLGRPRWHRATIAQLFAILLDQKCVPRPSFDSIPFDVPCSTSPATYLPSLPPLLTSNMLRSSIAAVPKAATSLHPPRPRPPFAFIVRASLSHTPHVTRLPRAGVPASRSQPAADAGYCTLTRSVSAQCYE